jgi:membrane-bound lytic murein transglycosylase D
VRLDAGTASVEDALGQIDGSALTSLDFSAVLVLPGLEEVPLPVIGRESPERLQAEYVLELAPWPQAGREQSGAEDLPPGAQAYVSRLKPIFVAEGVPAELVWLAEVESGFDTRARSSIGAAGLFQLMPETAKSLGLTLAPWDQRLEPEKNARAAARYLKHLHETFRDWRLSVAAYNAGEGLVSRLLEKRMAHGYDGIAADLPAETQMYVPKVETTILQREGVALQNLKLPKPEQ